MRLHLRRTLPSSHFSYISPLNLMTDDTSDEDVPTRCGAPFGWSLQTWVRGVRGVFAVLILVATGTVGCGGPSVSLDQDPSAFEEEERALEARLSDNPEDAEALRDLGSIYLRTNRSSQAYDALKKAFSHRSDDPKVLFYLGLASEKVGRRQAALKLFRRFDEVPEDSQYHTLMEGRYEWLIRQQAERDAQEMIAQEKERPGAQGRDVSPNVVAVVPMQYQGGDDDYQPLGRGLAEMFTTDLSNVGRLQVVERVRLQALLDELELGQSEYVDQSTAPRVGRLLGAGRVVGGSYLVTEAEELRLQVTLADVATGEQTPQLESERAGLDELFDLQTRVTFSIVDQLGVDLTAQERAAIQEVPTEDLQAFLAYSRGLMEEDRGNFGAAAQHFQRAQQIDPGFEQAAQQGEKATSMEMGGGTPEDAVANEAGGEGSDGSINVVEERLKNMGAGANSAMGDEDRDPAQEAGSAENAAELDDPPRPPSSGGSGGG